MSVIQARGVRHAQACVRCGVPARGPYCPAHRPKHYDPTKPFWGGQHTTAKQSRERKAFLKRNPICEYCGVAKATQVDHVVAQSRGGADTEDNWAASCGPCNLRKGER